MLTDPAGRPAPEYFVLAFPVERSSWTTVSRRIVAPVRPATDGRYRIAGLPAGDYWLAVVTTMDPDSGTDPEFLESILSGAIKITVGEGETKRQDLRIGKAGHADHQPQPGVRERGPSTVETYCVAAGRSTRTRDLFFRPAGRQCESPTDPGLTVVKD